MKTTENIFSSSLVPLTPTGFNFTATYPVILTTTITFKWDRPQSPGPESIVEYYEILLSSMMESVLYTVSSSPWNVTLDYNVNYNASITAINCAGKSNPVLLYNIDFGNNIKFLQGDINYNSL